MQTAWLLQMPDQSLVWLLIPSLASQQVDFPYCKPTVFRRVVLWGWVFWTAIKKRVIFFFNLSRKLRQCKLKPEPLRHEAPYFSEPPPCPTLESRVGAGHWAALRAAGAGAGPWAACLLALSQESREPGASRRSPGCPRLDEEGGRLVSGGGPSERSGALTPNSFQPSRTLHALPR